MGKSVNQCISFLRQSKDNYIKHYLSGGSLYDDEGNDCGDLTQKVLDKLVSDKSIIHVGKSDEFWSDGYYKLNTEIHPIIYR